MSQGDDLLIYTHRRELLINFLKVNYLKPNKKVIKFEISDCIKYQIKNEIKDFAISKNEIKIDLSLKRGYLKKYCIKLLKNIFIEKFAVLSNLGLVYFDIHDNHVKRLIPLAGSTIKKVKFIINNKT